MTTAKQLSYIRSLERRLNRDPLPFPELLSSAEASKYIETMEDANRSARRARRGSGSLPAPRLALEPQSTPGGISPEVRRIIDEAIAEAMSRRLARASDTAVMAAETA